MKKGLSKTTRSNIGTFLIVIIAYIVCEILLATGTMSSGLEGLLVPCCYYIILSVALNLVVGYLGELSLGHAGFMCVGAFSSAFFTRAVQNIITNQTVRFILAILIGAAVAALFGFLIGIPVLRLKGDYLAIVTLAFGEIIKNLVNVMYIGRDSSGWHISLKDQISLHLAADGEMILSGPQGIGRISKESSFTAGFILVLITLFIVMRLTNSRDGRAIMSIRDNRIASESIGINITKYKLMAFTVSAALAGVGGVLYAHNLATLTATSKNFGYNMSIMFLVYVVLGGIGSLRGSVIAPVVLNLLLDFFLRQIQLIGDNPVIGFISDNRMLIYAIVLIAVMLVTWNPTMREKRAALFSKSRRGEAE